MDALGDILREINNRLADLDDRILVSPSSADPIIFIVGPPRSGTTLATQVLAYGLRAGYITNIAARFWNAPMLGIRVSEQILGNDPAGDIGKAFFESKLGQTPYGGGIHEFGYFWKRLIWDEQGVETLNRIQAVFGRPLVMKGIYPSRYVSRVRESMGDRVTFIAVQRPFEDLLTSALKVYASSGESDFWFKGWELPAGREVVLRSLSREERTAARLYYWIDYSSRICDFSLYLPNLCSQTNKVLASLAVSIDGINLYRKIPENWLTYHTHKRSEVDEEPYPFLRTERFKDAVATICERSR